MDFDRLMGLMDTYQPAVVIHLAAYMGVKNTDDNPARTMSINSRGTQLVARACEVSKSVKHIIYTSSSEVYGDPAHLPIDEDCPVNPKSVYAVSKLSGEWWVKSCKKPYTILRLFNIFGPGQSDNFVVAKFIKQAMAGEPITIYGTGDAQRAFCYVSDLCDAILQIAGNETVYGHILNIGNPANLITIYQLAVMVSNALEIHAKCNRESPMDRSNDREITSRCPYIIKATNLLDWGPKVYVEQGIKMILESMQ